MKTKLVRSGPIAQDMYLMVLRCRWNTPRRIAKTRAPSRVSRDGRLWLPPRADPWVVVIGYVHQDRKDPKKFMIIER